MFYQSELTFLTKIFNKSGISLKVIPTRELGEAVDVASNIFYKLTDVLGLHYIFFLLPDANEPTLLLIGPYESSDITSETGTLMSTLDIFCETIWGNDYKEEVIDGELKGYIEPFTLDSNQSDQYVFSHSMRQMESRYAYENQLLKAVVLGQTHKAEQFFPDSEKNIFDNRLKDTLRNTKNYLIIMNTLCRKAAEEGGVHPLYLDKLSSQWAIKIESLSSTKDIQKFMRDIFKSYCKLVKSHNTSKYSKLVQNTILYIDSFLDSDLSLSILAKQGQINPSYLSTLFKKEVGVSITEYITTKRIELAKSLLKNSDMQIQLVAQKCGILDVQYFSKVFKKQIGLTPRDYRQSKK